MLPYVHLYVIIMLPYILHQFMTCLISGSLPSELSQLKKLEILAVDKNGLKTLPAGLFTNLTHLKTLSLSSNQLTAFPEGLGALRHLDAIDLSDNKLRTLPNSVGDLQVVELNMNRNQIASLPDSLARCPRLKVLRIEENCLSLEAVTPQLLKESSISLLAVEGNLFDIKQLRETEGYDQVITMMYAFSVVNPLLAVSVININCYVKVTVIVMTFLAVLVVTVTSVRPQEM